MSKGSDSLSEWALGFKTEAVWRLSPELSRNYRFASEFGFGFAPGFPGASRRPTLASTSFTKASLPQGRPV